MKRTELVAVIVGLFLVGCIVGWTTGHLTVLWLMRD